MQVNPSFDPGTGNTVLGYPNFNYQGTEFTDNAQDASLMENLHVDVWVAAGNTRMVKITPIDNSGVGPGEVLVEVPLTPGAWNSVDLPKSMFGDMSWNSVFQIKFDGQFNSDGSANTEPYDIYVDNMYFWKEPTAAGSDATLSDLQVDGTTVDGFSAGQYEYTVGLPGGSTDIPEVAATSTDGSAAVTVTQATALPGQATVDVTSANGANMLSYTVSFTISSPIVGAPDPTEDAADVISLFSDAYTDVAVDTWRTEWSNTTFEDVMIDGNPTKKYSDLVFTGIETVASPVDASEMLFFNMDIWSPNMDEIRIKLVDFLGDGFEGGNGDTEAEVALSVTKGEWQSIKVPLSNFTDLGMTSFSDINQLILVSVPSGSGIVYVDNVYFGKAAIGSGDTPLTGAPDPTDAEMDVISLFSDSYTDVTVDTWRTEWSSSVFEDVMVDGNQTKLYTSLDFNGIETVASPVDASDMMFFNMNVWSPNMDQIKIKLVDFLGDGFQGGNGDTEAELILPVTTGEWMSLKLPLSDFTDLGMTSFADINQFIIASEPAGTGIVYVDNVFFSRMSTSTTTVDSESLISIFPNPIQSGSVLNLSSEVSKIEILNIFGATVLRGSGASINMELAKGSYVVKATANDGETQVTKLMVF